MRKAIERILESLASKHHTAQTIVEEAEEKRNSKQLKAYFEGKASAYWEVMEMLKTLLFVELKDDRN